MVGARSAFCVIVFFLAALAIIVDGNSQQDESCILDDDDLEFIYGSHTNRATIDDTHVGHTETMPTQNIEELKADYSPYLSFVLDKKANSIIVSTTSEFLKYEKNETGKEIRTPMNITCKNGKKHNVIYTQRINDINTFEPVFKQSEYTFTMYGILPEDFRLSNLIDISASDQDCSPDQLSFSIMNTGESKRSDLYIEPCRREGKTTSACLYANRDILPPYEATYTLKVKDRQYNEECKETTATFKLNLIKNSETFTFNKAEYTMSIIDDKIVGEEVIQMENGFDEDVTFAIEKSEYSEYFSLKPNYHKGAINVQLKKPLPNAPKTYAVQSKQDFQLTLKATWQNREATTEIKLHSDKELEVICFLPDININLPYFTNPDKVNDTFVGTVFTMSKIANVDDMKCVGSKYLDCHFDDGVFTVSTTKEFAQYEDLKEVEDTLRTNLTVYCPYGPQSLEFRQEIKDINNHDPIFDQTEYTFAFYNEVPESFEVTRLQEITVSDLDLTPYTCNFHFAKGKAEDDIFDIGYGANLVNNTCRPRLYLKNAIKPLTQKTLTLYVTDNGDRTTTAKIHIKVNNDNSSDSFKFIQNEYYIKVDNFSKKFIEYEDYGRPELNNGFDSFTQIFIDNEDYNGMIDFKLNKLSGKLDIGLKKHAQFPDVEYIQLPIRASWKGLETTGNLILVLSDDFYPPSLTSTTTSTTTSKSTTTDDSSSHTPPTDPTTELSYVETSLFGTRQFNGFNLFILMANLGIIVTVIMSALVLAGIIFILGRRFLFNHEKPITISGTA